MNYKVYLAGAILGLTYEQATGWRNDVSRALCGNVFNPMRGKEFLKSKGGIITGVYPDQVTCTSKGIVARDFADIRRCNLMLVNLLETTEKSTGTIAEIGFGAGLNKPIIVAMEEGNIHEHPFVIEPAMYVVNELEKAIVLVKMFFGEG